MTFFQERMAVGRNGHVLVAIGVGLTLGGIDAASEWLTHNGTYIAESDKKLHEQLDRDRL